MSIKFSIIIPALNEEHNLQSNEKKIINLKNRLNAELIIVDGGSSDKTIHCAYSMTQKVYRTCASRSGQLNMGADIAKGKYLIFLHADTTIDNQAIESLLNIEECFSWGFLEIKLNSKDFRYKALSYFINLRSKIYSYATGDQVLIIKKKVFDSLNGYKQIDLMEDIEITSRLNKNYTPKLLEGKAITSVRRWEKNGFFKTIVLMRTLRMLYYFGVGPNKLKRLYK